MNSIRTAVILAAGRGTRLNPLTGGQVPKPLLPFQGRPLIEWSIQALSAAGIQRIFIGTGHLQEHFHDWKTKWIASSGAQPPTTPSIEFIHNPDYATTGSILTLLRFKDALSEPFLLLEADLLYSAIGLKAFVARVSAPTAAARTSATAPAESWMLATDPLPTDDNVYVEVDAKSGRYLRCDKRMPPDRRCGVLTGIWALQPDVPQELDRLMRQASMSLSLDYETVLGVYSQTVAPILVDHSSEFVWTEIDSPLHHAFAENHIWPAIKDEFLV